MSEFKQCESRMASRVFSHYAYGDPLPVYARYIGENDDVAANDPEIITVYVRCEREAGHAGKHLARSTAGWTDEQALASMPVWEIENG